MLRFPDATVRAALRVMADLAATDLERALAASVVLVATRQGTSVPAWASKIVRAP